MHSTAKIFSLPQAPVAPLRFLVGAILCLWMIASPSSAALLIYEGFSGYDTTAGAFVSQSPNSNTVGLSNNSYAQGSTTSGILLTASQTGLEFGSLLTSSGSLKISGTGTYVASTKLSDNFTSLSAGTTLYSSYLVNLNNINITGSNGLAVRITSTDTTPGNLANDAMFNSFAVSRTDGGNDGIAVSYDNTWNQGSSSANQSLLANQSFLILSRFTQIGTQLSAGVSGKAEIWALTSEQFENFVSSGRSEAWLNNSGNVSAYSTETLTSGLFNLSSNNYFQFLSLGHTGTLDEVRFGTHLWDVTPVQIPEPKEVSLLAFAALAAVFHRKRKLKS